jgi:4-hydroxybutyrate CoA-transferase
MSVYESWKQLYREKVITAKEAALRVKSYDKILVPPVTGAPVDILNAVAERRDELIEVQVYGSLINFPYEFLKAEYAGHITFFSNYVGPLERMFLSQGNIVPFPLHLSQAARCFSINDHPDMFLCEVTPPDERGYMSFGACGVMYGSLGASLAKQVVVQVNPRMPYVYGEQNLIHVSEVDAIVEAEHDIMVIPEIPVTDKERRIGQYIAERIPDRSTIQLGIGGIPNAVAYSLTDKRDLGVHMEMMSDSVAELVEKGVVNGRYKTVHNGLVVTSGIIGSKRIYDFVHRNPMVRAMPLDYVNSFEVISRHDNFVSINAALTVDLTGQVASESIGHTQYSATGGQVDFVRGALASRGGLSFIALDAASQKPDGTIISRIVLNFKPGTVVTTPRSDVMYVVTEYGVADVFMKPIPERVKAMIAIAHPDCREELEREAVENGLLPRQFHAMAANS